MQELLWNTEIFEEARFRLTFICWWRYNFSHLVKGRRCESATVPQL
jgi:hypothetical protein